MDADDVAADVAASADLVFEIAEELDDEGADESGQTEPTAYEDSPPSRLQQAPQRKPDSSRRSSKDAAEHKKREEISYEAWQRENENSGSNKDDKGQERRSSRHPEASRHQGSSRLSERSRHQESSRPRGTAHREEASRHHESPRRRDTARRREASPADRRHRSARSSPEARLVTVVPKFMEAPTRHSDRYSRPERAVDSLPHRARSPAPRVLSRRPRSPIASRPAPVAYERGHSPASRAHTAWPELFDAPAELLLTRPHPATRAPLVHPDPAWEAAQYDHEPYRSHPPATSLDYRHRGDDRYTGYAEHDREHPSYRESVYRDSGYADAGYTAASDRDLEYRPSSYDYGRDPYREYPLARPVEVGHDPYDRREAHWEAPRHPEADRHYAYKDTQQGADSRWGEARYEREADRHVPQASASFTRPGSRSEQAHSRGEAHRPFRDNAPRLARDLAPRPKSYRDGQEARLDREGHPLAPRYAEEYSTGRPHSRDPYGHGVQPPPPPRAFRQVSPRHRNPRREEDGSDRHRDREPERSGHHGIHRPRDRSRPHADRDDPRGRTAVNPLALTSRSFAMEAAARDTGPQDADPQQITTSELPPPPSRPTSAAQKASTEGPRPSRASIVVRSDPEPASHVQQEPSRDSSPELNVEQGFLQAPAGPSGPQDRPFQRGHTTQQAEDPAETANMRVSQQLSKEMSGRKARETDHRGVKRVADEPEPRHAPHHMRDTSPSRHRNPGDKRKQADSSQRTDAHRTTAEAAARKESSKGDSHRQANRSNSKTDAGKTSGKDLPAAAVGEPKEKVKQSGGRVESKAGAEQAKAPPAVKSAPQAGKDSKATQRRPDSKVVAPSPAKVLGGKASERIGSSSRREVVVAKQAGQKRHSRSPVRSRSPKRRASLPDKRTPGNTAAAEAKESGAKTHDLPPPPARPGKTASEDKLPPPPARLEAKKGEASRGKEGQEPAGALPNSTDLPPPPPKPLFKDKPDGTGREGPGQSKDSSKSVRQHDKDKSQKHPQSLKDKAATKPDRQVGNSSRENKQDGKASAAAAVAGKDDHRTVEKSSSGRSGQKRSRSKSPVKPGTANGITAKTIQPKPSDAKRVKSPPDAKRSDAKAGSVPNGKASDVSKGSDKDLKKEWIYADKSKEYGPCTLLRLRQLKKQLQEDTDRNKVTDFMICDIWRVGDRKNKQRVKDIV